MASTNEQFIALRHDIDTLIAEVKLLKVSLDPDNITKLVTTNFVAQFQSLEDRIVTAVSVKSKVAPKSVKSKPALVDNTGDDKPSESSKLTHCNFSKLPNSAWSSSKIYLIQMKKLYPQHIQQLIPVDIWNSIIASDKVTNLEKDGVKATDHQKARAFIAAITELSADEQKTVNSAVAVDWNKQNAVRNDITLNNVSKEEQTEEEASATL